MPLVDDQRRHRRLVPLSLGLAESEVPIGPPLTIDWPTKEEELRQLGINVDGDALVAT